MRFTPSDFIVIKKEKFLDNYKLIEKLGEGAYGTVSKCKHKATGAIRAVKMIKKKYCKENDRSLFMNEVRLLQEMDHPGIVKLYEVLKDKTSFYFVTELCEGGELFDEIVKRKHFTEHDAAAIMY